MCDSHDSVATTANSEVISEQLRLCKHFAKCLQERRFDATAATDFLQDCDWRTAGFEQRSTHMKQIQLRIKALKRLASTSIKIAMESCDSDEGDNEENRSTSRAAAHASSPRCSVPPAATRSRRYRREKERQPSQRREGLDNKRTLRTANYQGLMWGRNVST